MLAVFNVATIADTLGGSQLSLRDAILAANETLGPDTINLPAGHYTLSLNGTGEDRGLNGDLDILESVTIFGAGVGDTVIDANRIDRVLHVVSDPDSENVDEVNPDVRIFGLTIRGGLEDLGGGLLNQGGTVRLISSRIEHNEALSNGGAFFNDVHETGRTGMVVLSNSPVSHNTTNGVNREEALENAGRLVLDATSEILDGVDTFFGDLADTFEAEMTRFEYPIIGDQFADALQPVLDVFQSVRSEVHDFLEEVLDKAQDAELPTVPELIQNALYLALGGQYAKIGNDFIAGPIQETFAGLGIDIPKFSLNLLKDGPDLGNSITPEDIVFEIGNDDHGTSWAEFKFHLGQQLTVDTPSFDLGLGDVAKFLTGPAGEDLGQMFDRMFSVFGFNVSSSAGIRFDIRWDMKTGIGISDHSAIGVYLLSGATQNGLSDGDDVEELKLEVTVSGVPTADGTPNLQGQANLGLVSAQVTDGTPHDIKIFSGAGLRLLNDIDDEFDLIINGTETHHFSIDTGGPLPIPALLLYLNGKLLEEFQTPLPPLSFTLDFSAIDSFFNPDATSLPSLVLFARDPSISTLEIRGAEGLGFEPLQYEDLRGRNLGFGNNTASQMDPGGATQSLVGVLPAPAEGVLFDNPKFDLLIGGERVDDGGTIKTVGGVKVPIFFQEILSRDQLTPLDSLRIKLQETIQTLVGTTTSLPVSTVTAEIVAGPDGDRLVLVSHPDPNVPGSAPPLLTFQFPTDERTTLKFVASVDITDPEDVPSLRDDFPNDQRFFNRLPVQTIIRNANDLTQVFPPSVKGHAGIRLHVNMSGDNFLQQTEQSLGIAPGTLGLPKLDFDLIVDVDYDLKNAIKLAYQVLTGQVNPRDLINLDTLLGEIYQISKFQFANIQLDMRHFFQTIVSASSAGFAEVLDPVMGFVGKSARDSTALLNKRLPVISDIVDENVSMRSIFAGIGIDDEVDAAINGFLSAFDALADTPEQIAAFLDSDDFRQTVDARGKFQFGGIELIFDPESPFFFPATRIPLPTDMAYAISSAADLGLANFFRGYVLPDSFQGIPLFAGLTLDLVQPQNLMNLILGNPVNIVSWGPPKMNNEALAEFGFDFGELSFDISAFVAAYQNIRLAYDTAGLERMVRTLSTGQQPDFRDLLAGLFIQNNPNAPEIGRALRFAGSGSVDTPVFAAEGHVLISANSNSSKPATVGLEIRDPNHDGKLRLDEIRDILNDFANPENLFCIFDLVFDVRVDVGGSATFIIPNPFGDDFEESVDIGLPIGADISIVDLLGNRFQICRPQPDPPATLADVLEENGERILRINVGPHATARLYGDIEDEDTGATISARGDGTILVSGYGVTDQAYVGPFAKIVAIGSRKDDRLDFSGVVGVPVELTGDYGNDQLRGGGGADSIDGGPGDDALYGGTGNDQLLGGSGRDVVFAGLGDDFVDVRRNSGGATVHTEGGSDTVLGSRHADTLIASGLGNVHLDGGRGNDLLSGGDGDDELLGGDGDDIIQGGPGNDLLIGGRGDDSLTGDTGSDELLGYGNDDVLQLDVHDRLADGGSGQDRLIFHVTTANGDVLSDQSYSVAGGNTVDYRDAETIEVQLGNDADSLTIAGPVASVIVQAGGGNDRIQISSILGTLNADLGDAEDELTILDNRNSVAVTGGAGNDAIFVDRRTVESPLTGNLSSTTITGLGGGAIQYDATVERVAVTLGAGDDRLILQSTRSDALTQVNGYVGDDWFLANPLAGATSINGDSGTDKLVLPITVPAGQLATPFANVGFSVETLEIDNRANTSAIDWSLDNREVFGAATTGSTKTKLVDAVGADEVLFLVNPAGAEDLAIRDDLNSTKAITIADDAATITRFADSLAFTASQNTRTTQLVSEIDGLDGTIRNVVYSPDGRFVYVKSQTPSGGNTNLNQIVIFAIDPTTNRLTQTGVMDTPDDTGLVNPNTQVHTDMFLSADGTKLFEARLTSISVYLRDVESGMLLHLSNIDIGSPIAAMTINTAEDVLLAALVASSQIRSIKIASNGILSAGNTVSMPGTNAVGLDIAFAPNSTDAYVSGTTSTHGGRIWRVTTTAALGATGCTDVAPTAGLNTIPAGVIGINPQGDRIYLFSDNLYSGDKKPDSYSRNTSNGSIAFIDDFPTELVTDRANSGIVFQPDGSRFYLSVRAGTSGNAQSVREFVVNTAGNRAILDDDGRIAGEAGIPGRAGISPDGTRLLLGTSAAALHQYRVNQPSNAAGVREHTYQNGEQLFATIDSLDSLTLSPDGRFAYGINREHDSQLTYSRNVETGALTLNQVVFDNFNGTNGLAEVGGFAIANAEFGQIAIVAASGEQRVYQYLRDPESGASTNLLAFPATPDLTSPVREIAVSPDGLLVFIATDQKLLTFGNDSEGTLFRLFGGDSRLGFAARDIAISSDSHDIYVTAAGPNGGVKHLRWTGSVFEIDTIALENADDIAISRDGASVYVSRPADGIIAVFRRNHTTGALTLLQTIEDGLGGISGLRDITDLAVSADDQQLFVAGGTANTLVVFGRSTDSGTLEFRQRLRNLSAGVVGLVNPTELDVSSDGRFVYAKTLGGGPVLPSVVTFHLLPPVTASDVGTYRAAFSDGTRSLSVQSADGDDSILIRNLAIPLSVHTQGGDDQIAVQNTQPLDLSVSLGNDSDSLDLRSLGATSRLSVYGEAGDDTFRIVHVAADSTIMLDGGGDSDTFRIAGAQILSDVSLVGDSPTVAPGDLLLFDPRGLATTPAVPTGGDASLRANGPSAGTVHYASIETARILNAPIPVVTAIGTSEGADVTLSAAGTQIPFGGTATYAWDINGDGVYEDAFGTTVDLTWPELQSLGLDDDGEYVVAVRVTDTQPEFTDAVATLRISNTIPTLHASGRTSLSAGERYTLDLSASDPGSDRISRWTIDWNDGGAPETFFADAFVTTHDYPVSAVGHRMIVVQAFDEDGGAYSKSVSVDITAPPRVAGVDRIAEGATFTLNLLNPNNLAIDEWLIAWGDNTQTAASGNATAVNHVFADNALATIRVTGIQHATGARVPLAPHLVTVENVAPTVFAAIDPAPVMQGGLYTLNLTSTDPGDDVVSFEADLDHDGSYDRVIRGVNAGGSVSAVLQGRFVEVGSHAISVRAIDDEGAASGEKAVVIQVTNVAPVIPPNGVSVTTLAPRQGVPVLIQVRASDPGAPADTLSYGFDFDNNGSYELATESDSAQHVFTEVGPHTVNLRVTDSSGAFATATVTIDVANIPPKFISASVENTVGGGQLTEGRSVTIAIVAEDPFATTPLTYDFDLDNDGVFETRNTTGSTAHTFPDEGATVRVRVTDAQGATDDATLDINVANVAPTLSIGGYEYAAIDTPYTLTLGSVVDPGADTAHKFLIDWGDGNLEEVPSVGDVTHAYASVETPTTRTVRVWIEDDDGTHYAGQRSVTVDASDFGDAPAPYPTLLAADGARHRLGSALYLGTGVDADSDGQPNSGSDGDDHAGRDDEEGVSIPAGLTAMNCADSPVSLVVVASAVGKLDAWIDFNHDGDWLDAGEQVLTSRPVAVGSNSFSLTVPAGTAPGDTVARFRVSSAGGLAPGGAATDGEVEDYVLNMVDGDKAGGGQIEIQLTASGVVQVARIDGAVFVRTGELELCRIPVDAEEGLLLRGTAADDMPTIDYTNGNPLPAGGLEFDGAGGRDTLIIGGHGVTLDLTNQAAFRFTDIEVLNIVGASPNTLKLTPADVLRVTDTNNTLTVLSDADETVHLGEGWRITGTAVDAGQFVRILTSGEATLRLVGPKDWTNPLHPLDVNADGVIAPIDVLITINEQNSPRYGDQQRRLPSAASLARFPDFYFDTTGDGFIVPLDTLQIINYLNAHGSTAVPEGEGASGSGAEASLERHDTLPSALLLPGQDRLENCDSVRGVRSRGIAPAMPAPSSGQVTRSSSAAAHRPRSATRTEQSSQVLDDRLAAIDAIYGAWDRTESDERHD